MKKLSALILAFLLVVIFCPVTYAESEDLDSLKQQIDQRLENSLDEDILGELSEKGVTPTDSEAITQMDQRSFFEDLLDKLKQTAAEPVRMFGKILAVSLIYSAFELLSTENGELKDAFGTVCVTGTVSLMSDALSSSFEALQDSISAINTFMVSYIPVFAAVTTAGGHPAAAGVYSSSTILVCEVTELVSSKLLIPFLSAVTAISIVSSIDPKLKISGVADSIRKLTTWLLATVMLIFVGLMTVQGVTGSAADNLLSRTLRFAASSFIPVIGSSVSDAFLAVKSGMGVIRTAVGGFGMLAVFAIAVRPFLLIFSMKLTIWAGRVANELLGLHRTADFLKSINSVLSVGISILITITAAFLIATAALMAVVTQGG
ncbi:sporulation protein [Ruminococcus sp.]|uniref:stage III sporulation protein AE n=1 Tax=Ruminococcus sp. TaxID=41978 RepID=UPI0025F72144|nr:sporulation protein [Ruminococcus sp.]MBQ8965248.1 sporulation protein [Ruminococcus sp.]